MTNRAHATPEVRAVNAESLTVDIIASTFALDSYNTRLDPAGCEFDEFKRRPVICYGHDDRGFVAEGSGLPVARALPETIRVEDGKIKMRIQFTPEDINPFGYKVFRMVQGGFLSGVSVGFDPVEWEDHEEAVDGRNLMVRVYTKWRLVETSIVTIPANGEALVVRSRELNREDDVEQFRTLATEIEAEAKVRSARLARTIDDVLLMLDDCEAKELIVKHRGYFETKQPANKAATRFLKKLYKARNQEPPQEEVEAWEKAEALIEEKPEEAPVETPVETPTVEEPVETPAVTEETPEEPIEPSTPPPEEAPQDAQEAPEPARKASVLIPLAALPVLRRNIRETCVEAYVEASRQGMPVREWNSVIDAVGQKFQGVLTHP